MKGKAIWGIRLLILVLVLASWVLITRTENIPLISAVGGFAVGWLAWDVARLVR